MLGPFAWLLEGALGSWFTWLTVPLMGIALLTTTHMAFEGYKERLRNQGEARCDDRWEKRIRDEERGAAAKEIAAARQMLEAERKVGEELGNENERLAAELQDMLQGSDGSGNCLSGRVLEQLGKSAPGPHKPRPGKEGNADSTKGS